MRAEQLPFQFESVENMTLDSFHPGKQPFVMDVCRSLVKGTGEKQVFISGAKKHGKTHLLTACCQLALQQNLRMAYVPAEIVIDKDALQGMEQLDLVCIDDLDRLIPVGEMSVFNLINDMRNLNGRLLFSSLVPPVDLGIELPDLLSRLLWGPVFQLETLKNSHVKEALAMRASSLGLDLPNDVADYIYSRTVRDFNALDCSLKRLVEAASIEKRRFTIPFVRKVLGL